MGGAKRIRGTESVKNCEMVATRGESPMHAVSLTSDQPDAAFEPWRNRTTGRPGLSTLWSCEGKRAYKAQLERSGKPSSLLREGVCILHVLKSSLGPVVSAGLFFCAALETRQRTALSSPSQRG